MKTWCRHIKWKVQYGYNLENPNYSRIAFEGFLFKEETVKGWRYCPICGTPRPRKYTRQELCAYHGYNEPDGHCTCQPRPKTKRRKK